MKFPYATVALLCTYVVASKYRIDGGVDADFNHWPFVCHVKYGRVIAKQTSSATCVLIQFGQKYYAITVAHALAKTLPNKINRFIENNLRISSPRYAAIVSGFFTIEFGSAQNRTLSRAVIMVDENTIKLPLQYVDTLRDITKQGFAYDFLTIEILNHQWYEQRNAKFLDIVSYGYTLQQPLMQCKMAGWGDRNGVMPDFLQQTDVHMLYPDRCEFFIKTWASQYQYCISVSLIGDPVCFETSPNTTLRAGDSGDPIMCEYKGKSVMVGFHVGTFPVLIGGRNISISVGAPLATIKAFLELIN